MATNDWAGQIEEYGQFTSGAVTYIFTGLDIAPGGNFDMKFASWNTSVAPVATPEPSSFALLTTGLLGLIGFARRRLNYS